MIKALSMIFCAFTALIFSQIQAEADPDSSKLRGKNIIEATGQGPRDKQQRIDIRIHPPEERKNTVSELRNKSRRAKEEAEAGARSTGSVIRGRKADGGVFELMSIDENGSPVYYETFNENAALSTAVDQISDISRYGLSGLGVTVGVWDGGSIMQNHVEFAGRLSIMDGSSANDHGTHVGGTIGAFGVDTAARGVAPSSHLYSFSWTDDLSEMLDYSATAEGQQGDLYISNHSYGPSYGWSWWGVDSGQPGPHWTRELEDSIVSDPRFGEYDTKAEYIDNLIYQTEYYLPIWAAGNNRDDRAPAAGDTFYYIDQGEWVEELYDPAIHPLGDGETTNGYKTIPGEPNAKNVLTVGAVSDAVRDGYRDPIVAWVLRFSGWGPTADGRIKPDVVGNGSSLYSPIFDEDNPGNISEYDHMSGTSMAAPNVTGTAALLIELYNQVYPGHSMRATTLKALLIHTADDLETLGPDFKTGWGLVNGKVAADLILDTDENIECSRIIENTLTEGIEDYHHFTIDSNTSWPKKVTLTWSDPGGETLVNDLDLRLVRTEGDQHFFPYILDPGNPSAPATTGNNFRDPVEQVAIPATLGIPATEEWSVIVNHKGSLHNGSQPYSLIVETCASIPNDHFADAIRLEPETGQVISQTYGATIEENEPDHAGATSDKSVWYAWTATSDGPITINTLQSRFNTTLAVYTGDEISNLTAVASNDDLSSEDQHSKVTLIASAGTTYYIAIAGTGLSDQGKLVLNYSFVESPTHDSFENRKKITSYDDSTTVGATVEPDEPVHPFMGAKNTIWWRFVPENTGQRRITTEGSDFDTAVTVYTGDTLESLSEVTSNDNANGTLQSEIFFNAEAGVEYQIVVYGGTFAGSYANISTGKVDIRITPANDEIENRILISGSRGESSSLQQGATINERDSLEYGSSTPRATVWWEWNPPGYGVAEFFVTDGPGYIESRYLGIFSNFGAFEEPELNNGYEKDGRVYTSSERLTKLEKYTNSGDQFLIVIGLLGYTVDDPVTLHWAPVMGNDYRSRAYDISPDEPVAYSTNIDATIENGEPDHAGHPATRSVWFEWEPLPDIQEVHLDTIGSTTDTLLAVYKGSGSFSSLTDLIPVTSNDDYGQPYSAVTFCTNGSDENDHFAIAVDSKDEGGDIILNYTAGITQSQLTLYKSGAGSVLVNGVERDPLWVQSFDTCTEINLEPIPDEHYHFVEWQEDIESTDETINLILDGSKGIRAIFAEDPKYNLSLSGTASGQVMVDGQIISLPWSGSFYVGEDVVIRAVPAEGYGFDNWSGAINESSGVTTVTINDNLNITANFSLRSADKITVVQSDNDTTLYEDTSGLISNGQGQFFFVGSHDGAVRNGLLSFHLENNVPAGATITSATLYLHHSAADATDDDDIFFLRAAKTWGAGNSDAPGTETDGTPATSGDATWLHNNYPSHFWDNPGGDADPTLGIRGAARIGGPDDYIVEINSTINPGMLEDLQYWSDTSHSNNGWLLAAENAETTPAKRFHSSENPNVSNRPKLEITYYTGSSTPPEVTIDKLKTANSSPELNGTVNDVTASVLIGYQFGILWETVPATNNGDGTWTLAAGALLNLQPGVYDFGITATDSNNNTGSDITSNEVEIVPTEYVNEYCVVNEKELQTALHSAGENELNDHIKIVQGNYFISENIQSETAESFSYFSSNRYSIAMSGGYHSGCISQEWDASLTILDGASLNTVLTFDSSGPSTSSILVENLTLQNGAGTSGGGIWGTTDSASINVKNCIIRDNVSSLGGGLGLQAVSGDIELINCLIADNYSYNSGGGGSLVSDGNIVVVGNTIAGNYIPNPPRSPGIGGGLYLGVGGWSVSATLINNIIWNNTARGGTDVQGASIFIDNPNLNDVILGHNNVIASTVDGNVTTSHNNVEHDPLFIDEAAGDYHLSEKSKLIDTGDNHAADRMVYDIDGEYRMVNDCNGSQSMDIGADELLTGMPGDVNCSGQVDLGDVITILQTMTGYTHSPMSMVLDVQNNRRIDMAEALFLLKEIAGN